MLLSGYANPTDAIAAGEQIVQQLSESMTIGERELRITTSAGICFYPQDGKDIHTLTKHADCAMYAAKLQGKNRLRRFDASMSSAALDMLTLESELWKALERNEIELSYRVGAEVGLSLPQRIHVLSLEDESNRQKFLIEHINRAIHAVREHRTAPGRVSTNGRARFRGGPGRA